MNMIREQINVSAQRCIALTVPILECELDKRSEVSQSFKLVSLTM
jgi:hypothetical protein